MTSKVYAVKRGKKTGIFNTWNECKESVNGFPGAEYKSFQTLVEAEGYLNTNATNDMKEMNLFDKNDANKIIAYVDGSYNNDTNEFSYGMVVLKDGQELKFSQKVDDKELVKMHNVAGEIKGAEAAMQYAIDEKCSHLVIYHDYEGIAKWCLGEWKTNKEGTKAFKEFYDSIQDKVKVEFVKVLSHSNDKYNDMADLLAKKALDIGTVNQIESNDLMYKKGDKSVYLIRDIEKLNNLLFDVGNALWNDFNSEGIVTIGNQKRYSFCVNDKKAMLDIYQRNDGTTTLLPTGSNIELSKLLKEETELRGYRTTSDVKSYTLFLVDEWIIKTVDFLNTLCPIECEKKEEIDKKIYQFNSNLGDKLTLTVYCDNKVLVQGKPLFLYNEFISHISYSPKIEMSDIIKVTNTFIETTGEIERTRERLAELVPIAYNGKVDDVIWKLFSPSLVLIEEEKILEDYSCCVFPALRALEGYLLFLLDEKGIIIDKKHNFSTVFQLEFQGSSDFIVISKYSKLFSQSYVEALEEVYRYFYENRHVIFHVDQIFINTRAIEDKQEAITIVHEIADLINTTYIKAFK